MQMRQAVGVPGSGGRKLGDIFWDEFFEYILTLDLTANQNRVTSIVVQADAHFVIVSSYINSSVATGAGTFMGACVNRGGSLVQLKDLGSGRDMSSAQVPANCLFGTAQRPYVWPLRRLIRANTGIQFNVTDTTGGAQTVDYVLGGFKIPLGSAQEFGL